MPPSNPVRFSRSRLVHATSIASVPVTAEVEAWMLIQASTFIRHRPEECRGSVRAGGRVSSP